MNSEQILGKAKNCPRCKSINLTLWYNQYSTEHFVFCRDCLCLPRETGAKTQEEAVEIWNSWCDYFVQAEENLQHIGTTKKRA